MKCPNYKDKDMYQVGDVDDLYWLIMEVVGDLEEVALFTDYDTARELLTQALFEDLNVGQIEIDNVAYKDEYLVTFIKDGTRVEINVEPGRTVSGEYVYPGSEVLALIDYNLPSKDKYIRGDNLLFHYEFFVIGEIKHQIVDYRNRFEDDNRYAEISVSSNIEDFVNVVGQFFEDYFK